ncbi:MAG: DUF3098 domain-containing protein [Bacteroidales bacterium]|nr:DUF3098 domain-containing protein [Bacteroidales bacterium]
MAQVIPVENKSTKPNLKNKTSKRPPLFRKVNYILMIVGVVILAIGYICLRGGGAESPNEFSDAIFDTRRLDVAPILMLTGLVIEIFAIMWHPRKKKEETAE